MSSPSIENKSCQVGFPKTGFPADSQLPKIPFLKSWLSPVTSPLQLVAFPHNYYSFIKWTAARWRSISASRPTSSGCPSKLAILTW